MNIMGDLQAVAIGPEAESPIATIMEEKILLHLSKEYHIEREYECPTPWANFRIDLVITNGKSKIGIECDGKEFHNPFNDETRDALILGMGLVDTIWRFRGKDIYFAVYDCVYLLSRLEPDLFTVRGKQVLESQACHSVKDFEPDLYSDINIHRYFKGEPLEILTPRELRVTRNSCLPSALARGPYWKEIFEKVSGWTNLNFKEVVERRANGNGATFDF